MNLQELIYKNFDQLNEIDLYIWQYINHHQKECLAMSIQQLAKECNVSTTSILRLTKKIGLAGYSELKVLLKWQDQTGSFSHNTIPNIAAELKSTIDNLVGLDLMATVKDIHQADRIHIYPTGDVQTHVAQEFKKDFTFKNKLMNVIDGGSELDSILKTIKPNDLFVIISFSGNNASAITLAKLLNRLDLKSIGIAIDNGNPLSKYCTHYVGFNSTPYQFSSSQSGYCATHLFLIEYFIYLRYIEYVSSLSQ
ncbi:MAG: MurR/RpiR family transcriptional regulator [Erysipelotrichaceae bacterium]|nr:MurR/RpiR family transcriptional regulator [Erysipelotrichaceae bacterium]